MVPSTGTASDRYPTAVLFSILGISPAVLTETVWALIHETPPVIPDHIVVLTTRPGREQLGRVLFEENGWNEFLQELRNKGVDISSRLRFGLASDHIRLFPKGDGTGDLDDIVTPEDSQAAADFIMRCLREFSEDPGTCIIASIAGGRKTMGALLTSCMVLLGRNQDRLCHVLVSAPYDSRDLSPLFLFPNPRTLHQLQGRSEIFPSSAAHLELTDIPFVRVRGWYQKIHGGTPSSYMSLVRLVQGLSPEIKYYPQIVLDMRMGQLRVDGRQVVLSSGEFTLFAVLLRRASKGQPVSSWAAIERDILDLQQTANVPREAAWLHDFCERRFDLKEDARKLASSLRKKIAPFLPDSSLVERLVPSIRSKKVEPYPKVRVRIIKLPTSADVRKIPAEVGKD